MNKLLLHIVCIVGLMFGSQKATAQWDLFADLLSQMDQNLLNQFIDNLGNLDSTWTVDHIQGNDLLNDLYNNLGGSQPGGILDSTYIFGLDAGLDTLISRLPGFGLTGNDQDTLLGEIDRLLDIFGANFDSLGNIFGQYQDSLKFDSANWNVTIIDFDDLTDEHFGILQDTLGSFLNPSLANGPNGFAGLIGKLMSADFFPDLEIAFGIQDANLKYWSDQYSATTKVIRLGSVPRFDKVAQNCNYPNLSLPIEARWHVQASWNGGERSASGASDALGNRSEGRPDGFNPLLLSGDFAMMATPGIGRWGNTTFRIITSLGMEFGTYAPAHRDYRPPFTSYNKGYATGFGPQVGAGFSMTTGPLVIYSMATISHGDVVRCALPYKYDSRRFEVGMRFGNVVNVRYSTGHISWQDNDNRRADVKNQFTVGIILGALNK